MGPSGSVFSANLNPATPTTLMATSTKTYIVVSRIYDTLRALGVNVKDTAANYTLDRAFTIESGVCFAINRDGVQRLITVGKFTLGPSPADDGLRWVSPDKISSTYTCIDSVHDQILRAFFATLAGQDIPFSVLCAVSETAAALCVEYYLHSDYYAAETLRSRGDRINELAAENAELRAERTLKKLADD